MTLIFLNTIRKVWGISVRTNYPQDHAWGNTVRAWQMKYIADALCVPFCPLQSNPVYQCVPICPMPYLPVDITQATFRFFQLFPAILFPKYSL